MVDNNQHSLIDGISNYIRMNNSGALMITGNWGCGKTFFIKNTVIPSVKDSLGKNIIMVSLFGITDLSEIPERILYAYWDEFGKENAGLDYPIPKFDIDLEVSDEDVCFENSIDEISEEEKELKEKKMHLFRRYSLENILPYKRNTQYSIKN